MGMSLGRVSRLPSFIQQPHEEAATEPEDLFWLAGCLPWFVSPSAVPGSIPGFFHYKIVGRY